MALVATGAILGQLLNPGLPVPSEPGLVNVLVRTRDFGVARAGVPVTIRMEERKSVVLDESLETDKTAFGVTDENGDALIAVYPSSTLLDAGYVDTYEVILPNQGISFRIRVTDGGGNVVGMKVDS